VSVLEDHQNGLLGRETLELPDQRIENSRAANRLSILL
jgi:hypothetical protein